jgi:hypothetical protein
MEGFSWSRGEEIERIREIFLEILVQLRVCQEHVFRVSDDIRGSLFFRRKKKQT